MKKKLVFVIPSLASGGAEKSLVNLLGALDFDKFSVDLVLLDRKGVFLNSVPRQVNILSLNNDYYAFGQRLTSACLYFVSRFKFSLLFHRIAFAAKVRLIKNRHRAEQYLWRDLRTAINVLPTRYDAAIGYLEKTSIYFCIDRIAADKKIGFVRTDYSKLGTDLEFDRYYMDRLNYLCTNGENSRVVLEKIFPKHREKMKVIKNIVSPTAIRKMALQSDVLDRDKINLVSVGRLDPAKGYDLAINACAILVKEYPNLVWTVIGEGNLRATLEPLITSMGVSDNFILIGEKENPYAYMAQADVFVQCSRFEGRSSTINEAKILRKPIVTTNFDSVQEQLQTDVNALVVDHTPEKIAQAVSALLKDQKKRELFAENLSKEPLGSEAEIVNFYSLL